MEIRNTPRGLMLELTLRLPRGLHARPSAKLSQLARNFEADSVILAETGEANAKSMLDALSLGLQHGDKICLLARGKDAEQAITALAEFCLDSRERHGADNS